MNRNLTMDTHTTIPYSHTKRRSAKSVPRISIAYAYYRLSQEEANEGQSSSILNQEKIVKDYCTRNGIMLLESFSDDGWSGGNFERPGFQRMMRALENGKANMVITKDLSRLGRDMRESSYYAEQFFPEHQRYPRLKAKAVPLWGSIYHPRSGQHFDLYNYPDCRPVQGILH